MKFSYNWLQSFFKRQLPEPKKLADLLTLHFAEVAGQEGEPRQRREEGDFALDIDVRPNRSGDCFSHLGIAREISAITNLKISTGVEKLRLIEDEGLRAKDFVRVEVKNKKACPRYAARVVNNVKVFPSPKWLQERLKVCGLRPINNIVDATNYVMLEMGQPLHSFDWEKIEGKQIVVRFAKKGEKITTLDEENYELDQNILIIADSKDALAIAGIKGGKKAEIGLKTKTIVLESANFNYQVVRRGSKAIDLKTDASLRFEHGLDPNLAGMAIDRATALIQQISGGKTAQGLVDFYPQKVLPKTIKLDLNQVRRLLGVEIPEIKIKKILAGLGFKVYGLKSKVLGVEAPTRRLDVSLPEDLIEEIGRIYGYEKIPALAPSVSLTAPEKNFNVLWENLAKDILKELGFAETVNYSFVSDRDLEIFKSYKKETLLELENPLGSDFQYLRPSLIPGLLKNIEKNQKNFSDINIFELGRAFAKSKINESQMLAGAMTGDRFYEAKGVLDCFFEKLGIRVAYGEYAPEAEELKIPFWYPKRAAEIRERETQEKIGVLGEIAPRISGNLKIEKKVIVFEIDFEKLVSFGRREKEYQPLPRFPSALRDIALLVPRLTKAQEVLSKISLAGGNLLVGSELFDIYQGGNLPEGKKNLAFHMVFQAEDRTLAANEIDALQEKIIKALEENPEWQVRR